MAKKSKMADALAEVIIKGMQEKKAKNIVKIDLSHVNEAAADFFVVCHGDSDRQVKAIADSVEEETIKANTVLIQIYIISARFSKRRSWFLRNRRPLARW